ncbi:3-hydroxyacyl-ACP dehydratase FabZ [Paradevosia shaoguanensis]|uniref:3-hydroxyacyl-[acyl-carrier-protein] dehydratase FabZ n=1 Tax=Paradevosia shaoguanensis TaxID=1335043 RepID=A0AA41QNQ0_9HYPH|nr:3-hydroxyacyl-ACP dehydratase FabZ [Paradevosia shaoguanensis]MCF1742363.1 3-hydroxyacyl-ACP dehydratase FabZ [Paradevosia shaoguanensis]MCI0126846.1 3-hydroxyacyl-ACP dehydratase FabZ [Paradevosia shaoguanensis]CDP54261.1 (3R)-hydroxymyristoyl-[acyl carrier protein] dehyd ratase [Devosia sp. DBB001]
MDTSVMEQPVEKTELNSLDIARILECLPHRYPFLMIDRIINMNGDDSAVGVKNVTFNEPIFQGHFPGKPIFPGVLIIEGMAQTAGATVIAHDAKTGGGKSIVLLLTIDKAKFRKPAEPGDRIEYHIRKIQRRRSVGRYEAKAMVDGTVIAEAEIGAMIVGE